MTSAAARAETTEGNSSVSRTAARHLEALMGFFNAVHKKRVIVFLEQLALMIESGLAPATALESLVQQESDPRFARALRHILQRIQGGVGLTASFAMYPELFPTTTIVLLRAGEEGGDIAGRMRRAAQLLQKQLDFRTRLKQAVSSPLTTAAICGVVIVLVIKLVFPKFISMYREMELEFPAVSNLVFSLVEFIDHPLTLALLAGSLVASVIFRRQLKQKCLDLLLWFPLTQPIVGKILCASLCETLAYLHKDGVPVQRALHMLTETTEFEAHRIRLRRAKRILTYTGSLSEAMHPVDYFPPVFHSMLAVGEESGNMDQLLAANQRLMEEEIDHLIRSITAMLEPMIICLMGLAMAVLFIGMFLPIYGILSKLGG